MTKPKINSLLYFWIFLHDTAGSIGWDPAAMRHILLHDIFIKTIDQ